MSDPVIFGMHEQKVIDQLDRCTAQEEGSRGVLCADAHLGYSAPIGGVIGYREHISPAAVGFDIGCGNLAVCTNLSFDDIEMGIAPIMDMIFERVSFGVGRRDGRAQDHPVIDRIREAEFEPQRAMVDDAAKQLGTVGAGNHYVDLFADENDAVWVGVHFGSRGFGHRTASGFLAMAKGKSFTDRVGEGEMEAAPDVLSTGSDAGQAYIVAMQLAGEYAYAGREVVVQQVLEILGAEALEEVHNHHNFAWLEEHGGDECEVCDDGVYRETSPNAQGGRDPISQECLLCGGTGRRHGQELWVVRKGATPAFPGQRGFVGATMGEPAVILEGIDSDRSADALYSTVHGAGRAMSRMAAAGKTRKRWHCNNRDCDWRQLPGTHKPADGCCPQCGNERLSKRWVQETEGRVDWAATVEELERKGVELRGANAEEAPLAYKRLDEVLAAHEGTVRILHTLRPVGVAMAPGDTRDPFKD